MTQDDIIRMAREAGSIDSEEVIETVWRAFSAAEREACAKVCDKWRRIAQQYETSHRTHSYIMGKGAAICAHNIRARKP